MRRIHKTLASGLEVEFQVSEELVREYRECSAATDCKSCGWNNARIGRQCACSLPELRELLEDPSEELTGWKAQMMRTFCGRGGVLTMTIFEAINHCKDRAKKCDKCGEEHRQLQEWMEELLQYREIGTIEECREAVEKQKPGLREVKDEKSKSRSE